jgi:hypothetical protein
VPAVFVVAFKGPDLGIFLLDLQVLGVGRH